MKYKTRVTWKNVAGNQVAEPLRIYTPESLEQIIEIVREAERHHVQLSAVGAGHSFSDVAITTGFLLEPTKLNKVIPLATSLLNNHADPATLFHVESGIRLGALNEALDRNNLALINMGGYDEHTIAGAISTSTHGSGIQFGPLSEFVETIELVSDGGVVYRIEPTQGITNRAEYERTYPDQNTRKLIQNDHWFNAVVVSMGCMGVIYSLILRVTQKYWLKEVRLLSSWEQVKTDLSQGEVLRQYRHYEVLINPYKLNGHHRCLVTTRQPEAPPDRKLYDKGKRNFLAEFLAGLPIIRRILKAIFDIIPGITPEIINASLEGLVDSAYVNKSYKVLNIGTANEILAYSAEIGFPMKQNLHLEAVERLLAIAAESQALGQLFLTSPISLRFVKGAKAFLSPQHGYDTCMVEIIVIKGTQGAFELLRRFENELYSFSGRPHWGQVNSLTGSNDLVRSMYPNYDAWIDIYQQLNRNGTFDNPFSKRVGFDKYTFSQTS